VYQQGSETRGLDERLSELQAQIDQLNASIRLWCQTAENRLQPAEHRLAQLTERAAEIVDQWSTVGARHAQAVGELEARSIELNALETRVQHDASGRFQDLERAIVHEWQALRQIHEEPVHQLQAQAASLSEVCLAAATAAQRGLERSEARLAQLESDLHREMRELSRDVHEAVAELRSRRDPASISDGVSPWPLEGVMRLHSHLRQSADGAAGAVALDPSGVRPSMFHQLPEGAQALSDRINSLEHAVTEGKSEIKAAAARSANAGRNWRFGLLMMTLGVITAAALVWRLDRQIGIADARVTEAERRARIATDTANRQLSDVREDAGRQIAAARETALKAQITSDVLAAPDLMRYNLAGNSQWARVSAQALWSRSRGFVFSASRVPPPPAGSTYQIWISTAVQPVSAGVFVPDASGRVTLATDTLPRVSRTVLNVLVTLEPDGGRTTPSGPTLLARVAPPSIQ
jgi:Anti-sigma-K factor rskA